MVTITNQASIGRAPYEVLYDRPCKTLVCLGEVGERKFVGPEIVQVTTEKIELIKANLKTAIDRQKSYADNRRKDLEMRLVTRYS